MKLKFLFVLSFVVVMTTSVFAEEADKRLFKYAEFDEVDKILAAGYDVGYRDEKERTALMIAAAGNDDPMVISKLIGVGAELNQLYLSGYTAFLVAALESNYSVLELLNS